MTLDDLITLCQKKTWDGLLPILTSNLKNLALKILVTAVIESYHPDRVTAHTHGLSCWENQLSGNAVPGLLSLMTSEVDLADFGKAFYLAKNRLHDMVVANAIKTFVRKHKLILGQKLLRDDGVPETFKQQIRDAFGDLRASRYERETHARRQQAAYRTAMTDHLKAVDDVNERLAPVLGLPARLFSVSFPQPKHPKDISSMEDFPEINVDSSIKKDDFHALAAKLKPYDIDAKGYDMSLVYGEGAGRGIQLFSGDAPAIAKKLALPPKTQEADLEEKPSFPAR